jgi:hypothetical protein
VARHNKPNPTSEVELDEDDASNIPIKQPYKSYLTQIKLLAGIISALMVIYSFIGNIYEVPLKLKSQEKDISDLEQDFKTANNNIRVIEKRVDINTERLDQKIRDFAELKKEMDLKMEQHAIINQKLVELNKDIQYLKERMDAINRGTVK